MVAWGDFGGLRVESATRELRVEGPRAVTLDSSESNLTLESNGNLTIASSEGQVRPALRSHKHWCYIYIYNQ